MLCFARTGLRLAGRRLKSTLEQPRVEIKSEPLENAPLEQIDTTVRGETEITTLGNGIRICTENTPGHFSALGVYVDAGSRYETPQTAGMSHILDRLAFKATANRSSEQMITELESMGGNIMCSSSRESIMYQSAVFHQHLPKMVNLFADVIRNPLILPEDVEEQKQTALYEIEEIWSKPEMILPEILHMVAYSGNTLGNPLLCPREKLEEMTPVLVRKYRDLWYRPERIVVAAAGAPHEDMVQLVEQYFGDIPKSKDPLNSIETHKVMQERRYLATPQPMSGTSGNIIQNLKHLWQNDGAKENELSAHQLATQASYYTGGIKFLENGTDTFTHIYMAFEGLPIHDEDIYVLATLQILLGGGGSFSAGGPGKGMYSRLYTNVLNQYHWIESCVAFNHCYSDSGLFGISASCRPEYNTHLVEVMCREFDLVARGDVGHLGVSDTELRRAKNQLKSSLLMNLESRMVQLEDLGRQVQVQGFKTPIGEMLEKIEDVDLENLRRVASRIVRGAIKETSGGSGQATVVVQGNLRGLNNIGKTIEKYGLGAGPSRKW